MPDGLGGGHFFCHTAHVARSVVIASRQTDHAIRDDVPPSQPLGIIMADRASLTHPNAESFPARMSGPALRALARARVRSMNDLVKWTEDDLMALHGVGPKALRILKDALARRGRKLRVE